LRVIESLTGPYGERKNLYELWRMMCCHINHALILLHVCGHFRQFLAAGVVGTQPTHPILDWRRNPGTGAEHAGSILLILLMLRCSKAMNLLGRWKTQNMPHARLI
jgi:hypothetical protein